jgi:hypothetical protein
MPKMLPYPSILQVGPYGPVGSWTPILPSGLGYLQESAPSYSLVSYRLLLQHEYAHGLLSDHVAGAQAVHSNAIARPFNG